MEHLTVGVGNAVGEKHVVVLKLEFVIEG
jgi:hypothetical protein